MRKPRWAVLLTFSCAFFLSISAAIGGEESDKLGERHVEKDGGFSFKPPKEWSLAEVQGVKYKVARGPAVNVAFRQHQRGG